MWGFESLSFSALLVVSGVAFRTVLAEPEGSPIHHRTEGSLAARMLIVVNLPAATFSFRPDWFSAVDLDCCISGQHTAEG